MTPPTPPGSPARWEKIGQTTLATTRVLDLRSVRLRHPARNVERDFGGRCTRRLVQRHRRDHRQPVGPRAAISVRDSRLLPRDSRRHHRTRRGSGGRRCARIAPRETGYTGTDARLLATVHPNPAIQNNRCHLVLVENATASGPQEWDHDEEIEVVTAPSTTCSRGPVQGRSPQPRHLRAHAFRTHLAGALRAWRLTWGRSRLC